MNEVTSKCIATICSFSIFVSDSIIDSLIDSSLQDFYFLFFFIVIQNCFFMYQSKGYCLKPPWTTADLLSFILL